MMNDSSSDLSGHLQLDVPSLDKLVSAIEIGLKSNFSFVDVSIRDCPDLRESPFHLAAA